MKKEERVGPTAAESARIIRANKMWMEAATITDRYRADREGCSTKDEKTVVWRTYARAVLQELERRMIGGAVRWRKSRIDDGLPTAYIPFWRALPDSQLLDLQDALARARFMGED